MNDINYWLQQSISNLSGVERKTTTAKHHILHFIHKNGEVTPKLLQSEMDLSFPTASRYLTELTNEEYVVCNKGKSVSGGPRPSTYQVKESAHFCLGIDIGNTFFNIMLIDASLKHKTIECFEPLNLDKNKNWINDLEKQIELFIEKHLSKSTKNLLGLGISLPDIVNSKEGTFRGEKGIVDQLENKFSLPVFIENDTNIRLMTALYFGPLKGINNSCYIQVDWGIGTAISVNGKLFSGNNGYAGEIGMLDMNYGDNIEPKASLESLAGGQAIVHKVIEAIQNDNDCSLAQLFKNIPTAQITPSMVIKAVNDGNKQALEILNEASRHLAKAIAFIIHFMNPEKILVGGAIAEAGEYLLTNLQQSLLEFCSPTLRKGSKVELSTKNKEAGTLGAALLVLERIHNKVQN